MLYRIKASRVLAAAIVMLTISCGSKSDDKPTEGTPPGSGSGGNTVGTKYPLYVGALAIGDASRPTTQLTATDSGFRNRNIASGTPSEMHITVKAMHLSQSFGVPGIPIFLSEEGKVLKVASGYADLSDLFTNIQCLDEANNIIPLGAGETCECGLDAAKKPIQKVTVDPVTGEDYGSLRCPSVQPDATPGVGATAIDQLGTYGYLSVTIKAKAKVKGCVSGHFMYAVANTGDDQMHTYCTQADKSPYADGRDGFTNADYESVSDSKTPELMDFPLDSMGADFATKDELVLGFPIAGGVVIDGSKAPQITLAVDLGRALRFRGLFTDHPREEQENNVSRGAHFFSLQPLTYKFVFVGKPGKIYGHAWTATAGVVDTAAAVPGNKTCVDSNPDGCHKLAGWMTTIFENDGTPLGVSLLPDDDNALTVLKGSNVGANGFDKTVFTKKSENVFDIDYGIGSPGSQGLTGVLEGMDFTKAVDEVVTTNFSTKTMTNGKFAFGQIVLDRKL